MVFFLPGVMQKLNFSGSSRVGIFLKMHKFCVTGSKYSPKQLRTQIVSHHKKLGAFNLTPNKINPIKLLLVLE